MWKREAHFSKNKKIKKSQIDKSGETRSLKEVTRGCGGTCGSAYIDNNMRQWLLNRLGEYADQISTCTLENVMESFTEKIKVINCFSLLQMVFFKKRELA